MTRATACLLTITALLLAACGSEDPGSGTTTGEIDGDWTLAGSTIDGEPLVPVGERQITLTIAGAEASGSSACNTYFGTVEVDGADVRFTGLGGTEMGCEPDVMTLEQDYLAALGRVTAAADDGDELVLTGDGVELRFTPVVPAEPEALIGTPWVLEATIGAGGPGGSASSPVGEPATLELSADGEVSGSTGCNGFGGTYELTDDELTLSDLIQTTRACANDVNAQEQTISTLLHQTLTVSIDGEFLTLTAADGSGLVYRRQGPTSTDPVPPVDPGATPTGWWLLRAGTSAGTPIEVGDRRITLGLTDVLLTASVGCNDIGADIRIEESTIDPAEAGGGLGSTDMLCEPLMDLESAYLRALTLPLAYERSGDQLVLRGEHGELTFERERELDPATIVDRTWTLDAVVDAGGATTPAVGAAEIIFAEDGTFRGTAGGCAYGGTYVLEGDHLRTPDYGIEDPACTMTPPGYDVFAAQGDGMVPVIEGDTMTITFRDGTAAIYVAERPAG